MVPHFKLAYCVCVIYILGQDIGQPGFTLAERQRFADSISECVSFESSTFVFNRLECAHNHIDETLRRQIFNFSIAF